MAMNMAMHQNAGPGGPMSQSRHSGGGPPNNQGGFFPAGVPRIPSAADLRAPLPVGRHIFHPFNRPYPKPGQDRHDYDAKQARKSSMRKTVDYYASAARLLENRLWQRDFRDRHALQPDVSYYPQLVPPSCYLDNPSNAITTRFTKVATNKIRCPVFCLTWTPEGRRLITGASSGEFTLWNGLTFNFETILQAHDSPVRSMVWSHNDIWMVTGDNGGYVKYWQSNMNNVKMFQAHKEAIRGISFAPTDQKLATCSDDGTVRIWDFVRCHEERILRGHGADVKCVDWHPYKGLIVSGSKDNQQPVKLWDPKSGQSLATLHHHKSTVMDARWNQNGNWLLTASRDHLIKLYDIRRLDQELQNFRGHKREASCLSWHPFHQDLFASGGSDGAIMFWNVGVDKEVGAIEQAHESLIWSLAWHPIGHILCSGSNDHTSKFWTRNRPGDKMRDKYNLNTLPPGIMPEEAELIDEPVSAIPGMGPDDKVDLDSIGLETEALSAGQIPGLDMDPSSQDQKPSKKVPYAKPIPRTFQVQWNEPKKGTALPNSSEDQTDDEDGKILGVDPVEQPGKAKVNPNTAGLSARYDEDRELYGDEDGEGNVAEHRNAEPGKHEGSTKATQQPSGLLGDFPRDFPSRGPNQAPMPPQGRDNAPRPPFYPPGPPRGPGPGWNRPPFMGGPPHPMGMQPFPPRFPGQPDMRPRFYPGMQQQQRFGPPRGNWPGPEDHGEDEYGEYGSGGNAGDGYSDNSKPYGDNFWPEWNGDHDSRPPRGSEEEEWMPRDEEQYQGYGNQQQQHHHYPQERWNNDGDMRSGRGYRRHGRGQRRGGGGGGYKNY